MYIGEEKHVLSGMILEASGKIGSDTWLFAGKEKKVVCKH